MKKIFITAAVLFTGYLIACSPTRNSQNIIPPVDAQRALTYTADVHPLVITHCSPCHIAGKGNKTPYNNYAQTKADIDEILVRINKNPGEPGFMPLGHAKLPDSTIQVFATWKSNGLIEK